jgi:hypothetical protein
MRSQLCPLCKQTITLVDLQNTGVDKACIQRQVFPCPHCQNSIKLPGYAETLRSVGVLFSVIFAPLLYYWQVNASLIFIVFAFGLCLIIAGTLKSKLQPATIPKKDEKE